MAEALDKVRSQLNDYFQGLENKQKGKMIGAFILVALSLTGIIYYFTRPEYVVLYQQLEPKQAGEIMEALKASNIRVRFGDTSGTILVTKEDEKRAQVVVATQGLPTSRFSYEDAFSSNSFMMTSEERAQRFIYAQQNYLASTIEEIPGVRRAVVNLTVPERTSFVFSDKERVSKASVFLELGGNGTLDSNSINGIVMLVSNAVQGLSPENVTIHGTDGRVLNQTNGGTSQILGSNDQINLQQMVKNDLEKSITEFLSTVYGHGNVVVMANVKLDFDSDITEIKEFSPPIEGETTGIIRSMQELRQNVVSGGPGGVPGTDTNTEEITQYGENEEGYSRYDEANRTINYEINELRRKIVKAQGQVQDVTVAVFLNSRAITGGELGDEERRELVNIISAAAGLDTKVVQVGVQEFNNSLEEQWRSAFEGGNNASDRNGILLWLTGIFGALVLGLGLFALSKSRGKKKVQEEELPIINKVIPEVVDEIDLELSGSQVKQQIEKLVNKKPDAVAQLLKNWLNEE